MLIIGLALVIHSNNDYLHKFAFRTRFRPERHRESYQGPEGGAEETEIYGQPAEEGAEEEAQGAPKSPGGQPAEAAGGKCVVWHLFMWRQKSMKQYCSK